MPTQAAPDLPDSLRPIRDADFGYDQARHLLWRAGFGGTPSQIQALAAIGPERAVDLLLDPPLSRDAADTLRPDAGRFDRSIMRPLTSQEELEYRIARRNRDEDTLARFRRMRQQSQQADRIQHGEMQRWWLERMIESPHPLQEKMTLFWHGHFATSYRTIENSYHMYQQNQLFRAGGLGSYAGLLYAIIRDPAMLAYLDNNDSSARRPNENLARELLELFSLGVGRYTERDIKEGARALTGYTFVDDGFRFDRSNHDTGSKRILGRTGPMDGEDFVAVILEQPACAAFMASKFYDFFGLHLEGSSAAEDRAVRGAIDDLARVFRASGYDVSAALRRLLLSQHFYHPRLVNQRIKSPVELVVGAIRSMRAPARDLGALLQAMQLMGQTLLEPPSVNGWDGGRAWINTATLFVRQNTMNFVLTGQLPGGVEGRADTTPFDPTPLLAPLAEADPAAARRPADVIDYLLRFALGSAPSHARFTLEEFASGHGGRVTPAVLTGMLVLITSMPEYQLC